MLIRLGFTLLPLLLPACAAAPAPADPVGVPLRVMTWNLRYASEDPPAPWSARRDGLAEVVRAEAPDLLGTQEGLPDQLQDLAERLPGFAHFGLGRDANGTGEHAELFWRTDRLERLDGGHFWISSTPDVPATRSWDSACNRIATWARFRDRESGLELFVLNTHLDHASAEARRHGAALIAKRVVELAGGSPVIVTGDFNAAAGRSIPWKLLAGARAPLRDTWDLATEHGPLLGTYHAWDPPTVGGPRIDWILCAGPLDVRRVRILDSRPDDVWPSDHLPVTADLAELVP